MNLLGRLRSLTSVVAITQLGLVTVLPPEVMAAAKNGDAVAATSVLYATQLNLLEKITTLQEKAAQGALNISQLELEVRDLSNQLLRAILTDKSGLSQEQLKQAEQELRKLMFAVVYDEEDGANQAALQRNNSVQNRQELEHGLLYFFKQYGNLVENFIKIEVALGYTRDEINQHLALSFAYDPAQAGDEEKIQRLLYYKLLVQAAVQFVVSVEKGTAQNNKDQKVAGQWYLNLQENYLRQIREQIQTQKIKYQTLPDTPAREKAIIAFVQEHLLAKLGDAYLDTASRDPRFKAEAAAQQLNFGKVQAYAPAQQASLVQVYQENLAAVEAELLVAQWLEEDGRLANVEAAVAEILKKIYVASQGTEQGAEVFAAQEAGKMQQQALTILAHLVPEKSSASLSADYVSFLSEILWQELSKLEGIEKLFSAQQVAAQLQQAWDKPVAAKLTTSPRWPVPDELKVPLAIVQQYQTWQDVTASDPQWHENLMHQALNWTIFVQWKQKNHQAKIKTAKLWELAAQEEDLGQLIQSLGRLASEGEAYLEKYQAGQSTPPEMSWAREVFGQAPNEKVSNIKQDVTSLQEVLEIAKILELQKAGKVGLQLHHLLDVIDPQTQQLDVAQTKRNYNGYFAVLSGMILDQYPWLTKLRYSSTNSVNAFSPRTMVPGTGRSSEGAEISRPYLDALTTVARNLAKFSTGPAVNRQHYNYWAQEGRKIVQQLNQDLRQNITQSIRQTMGAKNYKDISSLLTTSAYFSQNFMQQYEAMGKMIINWSAAQELQGNGFLPDLGELISTEVVTRGFNCLLLFDLIGPLASGLSLRVSKSMLQWARQGAAVGRWARWRNTATTSVGKGLHWLGVTVHDAKTYYLPQDLRDMFGMGAMLFIIGDLAVQSQQTFFGPIMRNVETKQAMQNLGYTQKMNLTNDDDVAKARAVVTGGTTGILINVVTLAAFAYIFRGVNWFEKPRTVARSGEAVKNQQNIAIRNNAYERMGNKVEVQETKIRAQTKDSPEAATAEDAVSKEVQTGEERTAYIVFAKTKGMDAANLRQELAAKLMATGRERFVALAQQVQEGASTKTQAKIPQMVLGIKNYISYFVRQTAWADDFAAASAGRVRQCALKTDLPEELRKEIKELARTYHVKLDRLVLDEEYTITVEQGDVAVAQQFRASDNFAARYLAHDAETVTFVSAKGEQFTLPRPKFFDRQDIRDFDTQEEVKKTLDLLRSAEEELAAHPEAAEITALTKMGDKAQAVSLKQVVQDTKTILWDNYDDVLSKIMQEAGADSVYAKMIPEIKNAWQQQFGHGILATIGRAIKPAVTNRQTLQNQLELQMRLRQVLGLQEDQIQAEDILAVWLKHLQDFMRQVAALEKLGKDNAEAQWRITQLAKAYREKDEAARRLLMQDYLADHLQLRTFVERLGHDLKVHLAKSMLAQGSEVAQIEKEWQALDLDLQKKLDATKIERFDRWLTAKGQNAGTKKNIYTRFQKSPIWQIIYQKNISSVDRRFLMADQNPLTFTLISFAKINERTPDETALARSVHWLADILEEGMLIERTEEMAGAVVRFAPTEATAGKMTEEVAATARQRGAARIRDNEGLVDTIRDAFDHEDPAAAKKMLFLDSGKTTLGATVLGGVSAAGLSLASAQAGDGQAQVAQVQEDFKQLPQNLGAKIEQFLAYQDQYQVLKLIEPEVEVWNQNTIQQLAKQIFAQKAEDYNDILIGLVTVYLYTTDSGLKERILLLFKALDEEYGTTIKSEMKPMRNTHPAIFNTVAGSSMGIFYGLVTYRLWKYLQLKQTLGLPKLYDRLGLTKAYEKIAIQLYSWRRALQAKLVLKKTKNPCLNAFQTIAAHLAQEEAVIQGAGQGALTLGEEVAQAHQMMQKLGKSWALVPVMATMGLGISYETYATWQFHKQQEKMNPHAVETTAQKLEQLKVLAQEIELYDSLKQQYKVIGENLKDYSFSDAPEVGQAIFDPIIDITRQIGTLNATYQAIKQARDAQLLKADLLNGADEIAFVDEIKERVLAVLPDDAQNKKLRDNLSKRIDQLNDHTINFDQEFALLRDMYQVVVDTLTETDPNDPTSPESNINKVANYYGKHIQEYSRWLQAYYLELQAQEGPREAALILAHLAKQERSADTSDGAAAPSDDTPYLLDFVEGLLKIKAEDLTEAQEAQIWAMAQATPYLQKQFLPYFWLATAAGADLTDHPTVTMGGVENGVKLGIPVVIGASDLMNSCYVLENFARIPIVQYVIDKKAAAGHALKTTNPVQHQDLSAYLLQSYQNNSQDPVFKANDAASASAELSLSDFYQSIDNLLEDVDFWSEDRAAAEDAATDDAVDAEEDDADPADVLSGEDFIVLPPTSFDEAR